jgi:hypothetical protein
MNKVDYLVRCYPGFKYLTHARQAYYAGLLPLDLLFQEYEEALEAVREEEIEEIFDDALILLEFKHRKQFRDEFVNLPHFRALNQEIAQPEAQAMLKQYCFGGKLLSNNEQVFFATSQEFQQIRNYIHRLYSDLETKYITIFEENNSHHGWFSDCRKIPSDRILSDLEDDYIHLCNKIRMGVNHLLHTQEIKVPDTDLTNLARGLNQRLHHHYSIKVNQLFHYFPALMKINSKNHNRLHQHFLKLLAETDREIFYSQSDKKKKNDLIIRCIAMECYYILDEFTQSLGYCVDLQEINRTHALEMAALIYKSFLKNNNQNFQLLIDNFIKTYKKVITENILQFKTEHVFSALSTCNNRLGYTYTEHATQSLNQMWTYTISSRPARLAGHFITRFFDSMGFLQAMNLSTDNDIAFFFVAANATRISEEVGYVKRILFAIARMILGTIKHELYEASLEPNSKLRELKLAAIILFYTAMIALAAIALSFTAFMTIFAGFEFIAIPVAIILIVAAATLVTKVTFYLINAYNEWKNYAVNERMRDVLGNQLAREVLTLYKNALKSVDTMLSHLNEKTGLTHQELDFKVELEMLKMDLKKEWKYIRDDKAYPIDEIKKIIDERIKYLYDKEKCRFHGHLQDEVTHRFEAQKQQLTLFCTKPSTGNHQDSPQQSYKYYSHNKNEAVFFKQRIKKLNTISEMLEEKHNESKRMFIHGY